MKEELFLSTMFILLLFNIGVVMINPSQASILNVDIGGFLLSVLTIGVASGINVFSSGLSDSATRLITGSMILFNIFFQISVYDFTLGFGFITTVFNVFNGGDILGYGIILSGVFTIMLFVTGLLILLEGS